MISYERIVLIIGRLWNQDSVRISSRFDEVMGTKIGHDLGAGKQFDVKLLLELVQCL